MASTQALLLVIASMSLLLQYGQAQGGIQCPVPDDIDYGDFTPRLNSYSDGDVISYYCDIGYTLKGNSQRTCQSTGDWSGNDPVCVRQ